MAIKARDKLAIKRSRKGQGKRHKLEHILYLSILAGLMGASDYKQMSIWGTSKNHL